MKMVFSEGPDTVLFLNKGMNTKSTLAFGT